MLSSGDGSISLFLAASTAATSGEHATSEFGPVLLGLAILVLGAKLGGLLVARLGQPAVLGELLFGIVLANFYPLFSGNSGIDFVRSNSSLRFLAEIGVLVLLFDVGLETDLRAFVKVGLSAILVAIIGVVVPFFIGWGVALWCLPESSTLVHIFIGATLTATSVGITVRVLKDLNVTNTPEGQTIIGSAILDDILGLIVLAVVVGTLTVPDGSSVSLLSIAAIVFKATAFLGITIALGHLLSGRIVRFAGRTGESGMLHIIGLALCFTFAYVAEWIGLAGIIGAFAAGVFLDPYGVGVRTKAEEATLRELLHPLSNLLVPLFFALMGLQVNLASLATPSALALGSFLIVGAIVGKLACAFGVVGSGIRRLPVGIGMIPRGEVGLIFAGIGTQVMLQGHPILSQHVYSAVVMMVIVTTLIVPTGLRWAFTK